MYLTTRKRRGTVIILVAVCLMAIMGFVAIAIDGGLLQHNKRTAQATADAAALAAGAELYANFQTGQGLDTSGTAATKALAVASANGFTNDLVNSKVTVNIPPLSGMHEGMAGYAEVLVEWYQARGFSAIWGSGNITVNARAVAIGQWTPFRDGILALDPTLPGSLSANGGGAVNVVNADVIVDSNAANAITSTGGGKITAPNFYITGTPGTSLSGGATIIGNVVNNQPPTPDPLAYLPAPDPSTMTVQSNHATTISSNQTTYLQPGVYTGGIHVSGQATLNMAPGIYYMDGGGFSFTGQGNLAAAGVMVYTAPKSTSDVINVNGTGQVNFTPPTTGPYSGIALWQERTSTNTIALTGNGTSSLYGTIYGQHALLNATGNGTQDVIGSQYISYDVTLGGNGNFNISWQQNLTARTRLIYLVE